MILDITVDHCAPMLATVQSCFQQRIPSFRTELILLAPQLDRKRNSIS
ncbi:hypothetical protein BDD14_6511 [Edaphobacter modestus]|uniref:Uncharacterized protein n=1 Tax=Edaphobacter modestus TaxID=388466 RepID=A0A4V2G1E2_9BACT|nr:hypothetical protein BDD14_6511 [Edaphobacter modestus]